MHLRQCLFLWEQLFRQAMPSRGVMERGAQRTSRLRLKQFSAVAKALEVSFNRKFLSSPSSHLT